jgi:SAM-dependent methyltransferase
MKIGKEDLVLEIGSGDNPHPRSDVLVDKFPASEGERGGALRVDRPVVVADLEKLPFADQSFDYVICKHVIEHLRDPAKGLAELARVAKRGYIESPSLAGEVLFGWSFHRWVLSLEDGVLVFTPKNWANPLGGTFHDLAKTDFLFKLWLKLRRPLFHTVLEWEGKIPFHVRKQSFADTRQAHLASFVERQKFEAEHRVVAGAGKARKRASLVLAGRSRGRQIDLAPLLKRGAKAEVLWP